MAGWLSHAQVAEIKTQVAECKRQVAECNASIARLAVDIAQIKEVLLPNAAASVPRIEAASAASAPRVEAAPIEEDPWSHLVGLNAHHTMVSLAEQSCHHAN